MVSDERLRDFVIEKIKEVQEKKIIKQKHSPPKSENLNKSLMVLMKSHN